MKIAMYCRRPTEISRRNATVVDNEYVKTVAIVIIFPDEVIDFNLNESGPLV